MTIMMEMVSMTVMTMPHIVNSIRGTSKFQNFSSFKTIHTVSQFEIYLMSIFSSDNNFISYIQLACLRPMHIKIVARLTIRSLWTSKYQYKKINFNIRNVKKSVKLILAEN